MAVKMSTGAVQVDAAKSRNPGLAIGRKPFGKETPNVRRIRKELP